MLLIGDLRQFKNLFEVFQQTHPAIAVDSTRNTLLSFGALTLTLKKLNF